MLQKSLVNDLLASSESIIREILDHKIILSLKGERTVSKSDLLQVRNNFYIQDYFYLTEGYGVLRNALVKSTKYDWLREQLGGYKDPLSSSSIRIIRGEIQRIQKQDNVSLSIEKASKTVATENYISFLLNLEKSEEIEIITALLVCLWVYFRISLALESSESLYSQDPEFRLFYEFFFSPGYNRGYVHNCCEILDKLSISLPKSVEAHQGLIKLFQQGCRHEISFLNTLLPT